MRDIINEIYQDSISLDEAHNLLEDFLHGKKSWYSLFGLSEIEMQVFLHGAGLDDLAKWRYEGWPDESPVSGKKVELEQGHWTIRDMFDEDDAKEDLRIFHLDCLPEIPDEEYEISDEFSELPDHKNGSKCLAGTKRVPNGFNACCNVFDNHTRLCSKDVRYEWWNKQNNWVIVTAGSCNTGIVIDFCPHCGEKLQTDWQDNTDDSELKLEFIDAPSIILCKKINI